MPRSARLLLRVRRVVRSEHQQGHATKTLSSSLSKLFRPTPTRRPDTQRKAREEAKRRAKEHVVGIEELKDGGMNVWPPKSFSGEDPWPGDHFAQDWNEALPMVLANAVGERNSGKAATGRC